MLERALANTPGLAVVRGESGIGKTRFVAEFAAIARGRDVPVLWGTCFEGISTPYGPWADLVGRFVAELGARAPEALASDAPVLAELAPSIAGVVPGIARPSPLAPDQGRLRLFEAVVRLIEGIGRRCIVVLDDLQLADAATIELFMHAARITTRCLWVITYAGMLGLEDPLANGLAEVSRHRPSEFIHLTRLGRTHSTTLLEHVAGRPLDAHLIDSIYGQSSGNPFFLVELGRHLREHGGPGVTGQALPEVPQTVLGALALRLAPLTSETRGTLRLASLFSASFSMLELQTFAALPEETVLAIIDEAVGAELLQITPDGRYAFSHTIARSALLAGFTPSRRERMHRRLAETLEQLPPPHSGQRAAEITRQYHASSHLPGGERGVPHARAAAEHARRAHAAPDAVVLLRLALDLVPENDLATRATVIGELALARAEALDLTGATRSLAAAQQLLDETGADGQRIADLTYEVCSTLAVSISTPVRPLVSRALTALGEQGTLRWARLRLLERVLEPDAGPVRWFNLDPRAVRVVREQGTEADFARTLDPSVPWEREELEAVTAAVHGWADPMARLLALSAIAEQVSCVAPDGSPAADRACRELEALADETGSPVGRAVARMCRGALLGADGQFAAAEERFAEALAMTSGWPANSWLPPYTTLLSNLTAMHVTPAWPQLVRTAEAAADNPEQYHRERLAHAAFAAYASARAGEHERARGLLADLQAPLMSMRPADSDFPNVISLAGAAAWELRDRPLAQALLPPAAALSAAGGPDPYMTCAALTEARLLSVVERFDQATVAFARARRTLDLTRQRPLRAIVDHDEAISRSLSRDPASAAGLMAVAHEQFAQLGMTDWQRRTLLGGSSISASPDGLTAREIEILRLVADGRTNKEVAATLIISVHTVERHIQNAYRKIRVNNRAEAAAYVVRTFTPE